MSTHDDQTNAFIDQLIMPGSWLVFPAGSRKRPLPEPALMASLPDQLIIGDQAITPVSIKPVRCQHDLCEQLGQPPLAMEQTAYVYLQFNAQQEQQVTIGFGWDHWLMGWLNGQPLFDGKELQSTLAPSSIHDATVKLKLELGMNTLVFRVTGGTGPCVLAIGGPAELEHSDARSLIDQPLFNDPRWAEPSLTAAVSAATSAPIDIAARRELFIDDHLIDALTGSASQRLHQPQPREIVLTMNQRWEGNYTGNFMPITAMQEPGSIRLYYYAANWDDRGLNLGPIDQLEYAKAKKHPQYAPATCIVDSVDGVHFERPNLGLIEFQGSKANNMCWSQSQYFTPFLDTNPNAPADAKYKAISRISPSDERLGAFASANGIHWRPYHDQPIITEGKFDSQNIAFWDNQRSCYVEYHRGQPDTPLTRGVMTSTSPDFIHWSKPTQIKFTDARNEHMYTSCIAPYARAPHLYIGTPARFITYRYKDQHHKERGISDSVLITSRDGKTFDRWEEGFLRPGIDPESWTDRNNYMAWGLVQTAPHELSTYWCEHNGHPGLRIRRGTLRLDGFVSIHAAGKGPGELLTMLFTFQGSQLEINFATSAAGTLLVELCDERGQAIPGYSLADSEILYGNEIAHIVRWPGQKNDLRHLAGQPVRLRVRLHDADLYSFRFAD